MIFRCYTEDMEGRNVVLNEWRGGGMEGKNYIPKRRFRKFHTIFYAPTQLKLTSSCTFYYYYRFELKVDALNLYSK